MGRTVNIGVQDFAVVREGGYFYVDKTAFVREWWDAGDAVTLVCRPRRFGKTLNLSMLQCFFSKKYAGRGEELFGGLEIWADERFRSLQGTLPVVSLTFSDCKGGDWPTARAQMCRALAGACSAHRHLMDSADVDSGVRAFLARVSDQMDDATATGCLAQLCIALEAHHGTRPIVLLDEYDTPMQEAWAGGWWDEAVSFQRSLFNATFKACPSLGRGLITGVTRVSRESIFSDLNNLAVVTTTTDAYETAFGFTEDEVFAAMDEMGLAGNRDEVREWYDGFRFGEVDHVYNPWSVINYLKRGRLAPYWANSSGNALVSQAVRTDASIQADFEQLLAGGSVTKTFDEQVVFGEIGRVPNAVWSLLVASGYLKVLGAEFCGDTTAELAVTNREVRHMFDKMVRAWFDDGAAAYSEFCRCLLAGDLEGANAYLLDVLEGCVSHFDAGGGRGASAPENFYHGLVLGLLVELRGRYEVTSNRESGYGRYDVMLCPLASDDPAFAIEFKVANARRGETIEEALAAAKAQIAERAYARQLVERGISPDRIREVGFAFSGKDVLIG